MHGYMNVILDHVLFPFLNVPYSGVLKKFFWKSELVIDCLVKDFPIL